MQGSRETLKPFRVAGGASPRKATDLEQHPSAPSKRAGLPPHSLMNGDSPSARRLSNRVTFTSILRSSL
eukprot:3291900-Prymnesium_polylepis.1